MIYESFDYKTEQAAYKEDMESMREEERIATLEAVRILWAQRNGNDAGFDPYAAFE